jgi:phosphoadenosine phosphosulfate reductase
MTGAHASHPPTPIAGNGWLATAGPVTGYPDLRQVEHATLISSRRRRLERLCADATGAIRTWAARCVRPYVSFSGGKDSTVLLHLARRAVPGIAAIFAVDAEGTLPEIDQMMAWWQAMDPAAPLHRLVWGSAVADYAKYGVDSDRSDFGANVARLTAEMGFDGTITGVRGDESKARTIHAATHAGIRRDRRGSVRLDPLLRWTADDVWAYLAQHRLPYCRGYDLDD